MHTFLAGYVAEARRRGDPNPVPLLATTNYDDALERAFNAEQQSFDVLAYIADGPDRGKFSHISPDGERIVPTDPLRYAGMRTEERPTILKLHGTISEPSWESESFVISEGHYVDYLTTDVWRAIPFQTVRVLGSNHLWFLGHAMRDWNLLVVLRRLGALPARRRAWAVQLNPDRVDEMRWERENVDLIAIDLVSPALSSLRNCGMLWHATNWTSQTGVGVE
ncbi:MAG: SIR2 family protein [Solirubrobacteraceae bacterium]